MENKEENKSSLYKQDTDIKIVSLLTRELKNKTFFDVGAEKGSFARELLNMGFHNGVLFEPLPAHQKYLNDLRSNPKICILDCAVDSEDRSAEFNVACDQSGVELDYYHSLNKIEGHEYFKHSKSIPVICRSLESLIKEGKIPSECGVLKIDTEGNDLRVLQGIGKMRPELIICEFVPPIVYPDWELAFAKNLIPEAKKLGYNNFIVVMRTHGLEGEWVHINPTQIKDADWGNIIFLKDALLEFAIKTVRLWNASNTDSPIALGSSNIKHNTFKEWFFGRLLSIFKKQ